MTDGWIREYVVEVRHAELIVGSPFSHPFREEIVRCRDCKHGYKDVCERPIWDDGEWACIPIEPDGFCAWAVRRDE